MVPSTANYKSSPAYSSDMAFRPAPLSSSFLAAAILGLLVSAFYLPQFSVDWAFALGLVFVLMIISSFVSMMRADPARQLGSKRIK